MAAAQSSSLYGGWKIYMHLEANINHSPQAPPAIQALWLIPDISKARIFADFCPSAARFVPLTLAQLPGSSAVALCEGAEPWFGPSSMILPSLGICSVKWESESSWDSTGNLSHLQSHKEAACDPNMLKFAILQRRSADIKGCGTDSSWEFTPAFP